MYSMVFAFVGGMGEGFMFFFGFLRESRLPIRGRYSVLAVVEVNGVVCFVPVVLAVVFVMTPHGPVFGYFLIALLRSVFTGRRWLYGVWWGYSIF